MSVHYDKSRKLWYVKYRNRTLRVNNEGETFANKTQAKNFESYLRIQKKRTNEQSIYELIELFLKYKARECARGNVSSETVRYYTSA